MSKRKQHAPEFKAKVALEALKGEQTVKAVAIEFTGSFIALATFVATFFPSGAASLCIISEGLTSGLSSTAISNGSITSIL